jgi:Arc/MetJ-type ribon-helix-helix transcriptional regulator
VINKKKQKKSSKAMHNITINIPNCYEENIQILVRKGLVANRSEAIRIALGEFLHREYNFNLPLLDFFHKEKEADLSQDKSSSESIATNQARLLSPEKKNSIKQ